MNEKSGFHSVQFHNNNGNPGNKDTLAGSNRHSSGTTHSNPAICLLHSCSLPGSRDVAVLLLLPHQCCRRPIFMTGTTEGLPMDVAEDSRWQQEQQQQEHQQEGEDHKKELDQNELVRARLLTISQVAPEGEVVPLDTRADIKEGNSPRAQSPRAQSPRSEHEDEFRRKLMSISYVDVPMPAQ